MHADLVHQPPIPCGCIVNNYNIPSIPPLHLIEFTDQNVDRHCTYNGYRNTWNLEHTLLRNMNTRNQINVIMKLKKLFSYYHTHSAS